MHSFLTVAGSLQYPGRGCAQKYTAHTIATIRAAARMYPDSVLSSFMLLLLAVVLLSPRELL